MKETSIKQELKEGKTVIYYTMGISMEPLLKARRTHVVLTPVSKPQKYDILLYERQDGKYVLHRLLNIKNDFFYIRGDNTFYLEKIHPSQIIGKVSRVYRNGRYIDVEKSFIYKVYVLVNIWSYPLRFFRYKLKKLRARKQRG
ncbi:MAG: S24/S26 family peptidase [Clostridia bacterium]|nr:S24/S26 family peptidase [Clostridia bacterium]